ncbi:sigma-70 family RNA polymerase sigma factor [Isosphaeraceae bacterium EP7]
MDDADFAGMISRARGGDDAAARELICRFEADVRTMVRVRLPKLLRNRFDSLDFTQAVWASVFVGLRDDSDESFQDEDQMRKFLGGVVRNKVMEEYRRHTRTRKYDLAREQPLYVRRNGRDRPMDLPGHEPTPSQVVQAGDQLNRLIAGRTDRAAEVIELRRQNLTFEEIAARMKMSERYVRRIVESLRERLEEPQ